MNDTNKHWEAIFKTSLQRHSGTTLDPRICKSKLQVPTKISYHRHWVQVWQDPTRTQGQGIKHSTPAHLLNVFLSAHVRGLQQVSRESHVAMHGERLLRVVSVHSNTANVVNRLTSVTFLPHDIHVTVKLTRVGCLTDTRVRQSVTNFAL